MKSSHANALANLGHIVEESKDAIAWLIVDALNSGVTVGEIPYEAAKQVLPDEERAQLWRKINAWIGDKYITHPGERNNANYNRLEVGDLVSLIVQLRLCDPAATHLRPIRSAVDPNWMQQ